MDGSFLYTMAFIQSRSQKNTRYRADVLQFKIDATVIKEQLHA